VQEVQLKGTSLRVISHLSYDSNFSSLLIGYKAENFWRLKNFSVL